MADVKKAPQSGTFVTAMQLGKDGSVAMVLIPVRFQKLDFGKQVVFTEAEFVEFQRSRQAMRKDAVAKAT